MALKGYVFEVDNKKYSVKLSDKYDTLASTLGLTALTAQTTGAGNLEPVKAHVRAMRMIPVSITYKLSATSKKRRSNTIAVPIEKIKEAGDLVSKTWGTSANVITSVSFPLKANYS